MEMKEILVENCKVYYLKLTCDTKKRYNVYR